MKASAIISAAWSWANPYRLTGPIFDKELRVSSRRRRNYALRLVYLALLTGFTALIWQIMVAETNWYSTAYAVSRMSEAGQSIIHSIVWFQFVATQLVAVIMCANTIRDEIDRRTLGVLMSTPVTSAQIVFGKFSGKLLQLVLLLAISLPLLAVVRVFGGVPWGYLTAGLSVTLSALAFAGMLSMYFSIGGRRASGVIIKTVFTLGTLYGLAPWLVFLFLMLRDLDPNKAMDFFNFLSYVNPFFAMYRLSIENFAPMMGMGMSTFAWPVHSAIMLGLTALLGVRCVVVVRRAALVCALGQSPDKRPAGGRKAAATDAEARIRHVKGSPVVWKELRTPWLQGGSLVRKIGIVVVIAVLLLTYVLMAAHDFLKESTTHTGYLIVFMLLGLLQNSVTAATTVAAEKEARTWPLLLTTGLSDGAIIWGKFVGTIRRCLLVWLLMAGHLTIFTVMGYLRPLLLVHMLMIVAWVVVFLTGMGIYFSTRMRRVTNAVVANFGLALGLWLLAPMFLGMAGSLARQGDDLFEMSLTANPVVQTVVVAKGAVMARYLPAIYYHPTSSHYRQRYDWPGFGRSTPGETTAYVAAIGGVYMLVAGGFLWRAKVRVRRFSPGGP